MRRHSRKCRRRAEVGEWQVQGQGQVQVQVQVQVQAQALMSRCWGTRAEGHGDTAAREGASTDGWAGGRWRAAPAPAAKATARGRSSQRQRQRNSAAPGDREEGLSRKGLNRGLQVRGASRGSQMVSHKWFTATCRCMSGVRAVWLIGDVVLPAPAPADRHG